MRLKTLALVALWLLALIIGGTLAALLRDTELELKLQDAEEEIRILSDSLASLRRSCVHVSLVHEDQPLLERAAEESQIPLPVYLALIAVESGYSARYELRGRHGEYGRGQIKYELWSSYSADCASRDPESQSRCAAQILRLCSEKWGNWRTAIACYNRFSKPDTTGRYLAAVEREIGRIYLRSLEASNGH